MNLFCVVMDSNVQDTSSSKQDITPVDDVGK